MVHNLLQQSLFYLAWRKGQSAGTLQKNQLEGGAKEPAPGNTLLIRTCDMISYE